MMEELISNFESLSEEDMTNYAGEWVAVIDGRVVVHSKSFREVNEFIKINYTKKRALIGKLPDAVPTILSIS